MSYNQVNNNPENWKMLPDKDLNSQEFYTIQRGKGASMQYLPPMQGIIEKAKVKLRKQIKKSPPKKKAQSRVTKRRGKTTQKRVRKKPTKAKKAAPKSKGKKKRVTKSKK